MKLPAILLENPHYSDYVNGKEIEVNARAMQNRNVARGDHIMVYRDTIASVSDVSPPKREQQSEYIGVEGEVTEVTTTRDQMHNVETVQSIRVRKI